MFFFNLNYLQMTKAVSCFLYHALQRVNKQRESINNNFLVEQTYWKNSIEIGTWYLIKYFAKL